MTVLDSVRACATVAVLVLACGCNDRGSFLDYEGLGFYSHKGIVKTVYGSFLCSSPLPCLRLTGNMGCVLPLHGITEAELATLGAEVRQSSNSTFYEFGKNGYIEFQQGKLRNFDFRGPGVSIAKTKEGPFVSLPAPEQEIRKLFGEPKSIRRPSPPPVH